MVLVKAHASALVDRRADLGVARLSVDHDVDFDPSDDRLVGPLDHGTLVTPGNLCELDLLGPVHGPGDHALIPA